MSETRDNSGTLGKNTRREKDMHPTHSGQCVIDGKAYWISAWVKAGRDNSRFFSLAFKPKLTEQSPKVSKETAKADFDDDIPF